MKTKPLLLIATMNLALVLVALLDPWQQGGQTPSDRLLPPEHLASLSRVTLIDATGSTLTIEREPSGRWQSMDKEPLDHEALRELISILGMLRVVRESPRSATMVQAANKAALHYSWSAGSSEYQIGMTSESGSHQWLAQGETGPGLLVEAYLLLQLQEVRERLVSRKLIHKGLGASASIEFRQGQRWLRVSRDELQWHGREETNALAPSATRFSQLRDDIEQLAYLAAFPPTVSCERTSPVRIALGEEAWDISECGGCKAEQVGLFVGRRSGCADQKVWERIRSLLDHPTELLEQRALPTREAPSRFTFTCNNKKLELDATRLDAGRLQAWWQALDGAVTQVSIGMPPLATCILRSDSGEVHFGLRGTDWLAFAPGTSVGTETLLFHLSPEAQEMLKLKHDDLLPLQLISEDPFHASRITISEAGKTRVLERGELLDVWRAKGWQASELEVSQWALQLRAALSDLRALPIAATDTSRPRPLAGRHISIDFALPTSEGTKSHSIWVAPQSKGAPLQGACWVQLGGSRSAWVEPETCAMLMKKGP